MLNKDNDPQYRVEACDAGDSCDSNTAVSNSLSNTQLNQLIGYFKASNTGAGDEFGYSVSLSGDGNTLAVGATKEASQFVGVDAKDQGDNAKDSGAVYIFARNSSAQWTQQTYIKASNTGAGDEFGYSVSLSDDGNSLAVGAPFEDSSATGLGGEQINNNSTDTGVVYVFTRSGENWRQRAYIKASNTGDNDQFGYAVSLSGDGNTLVVGAPFEDSSSTGVDSVENNNSTDTGGVYVFTRQDIRTWNQQAYIKASNSGAGDEFGFSVSLSDDGNSLAVGARLRRQRTLLGWMVCKITTVLLNQERYMSLLAIL